MTPPRDTAGLAPGLVVTCWGPGRGGMLAAVRRELEWLRALRPDVVQLHSDCEGLLRDARAAASLVRAVLPSVRLWLAVGCDGACARALAGGPAAAARELDAYTHVRLLAEELAAEVIDVDPEAAYKAQGSEDDAFAGKILEAVASDRYTLAWTAYDQPTYHAEYAWRAWLGPQLAPRLRPRLALYQAYPAGAGYTVTRAMLAGRIAAAQASWEVAARKGWVAPDVPDAGPGGDTDVDLAPYLQVWGHDAGALVEQLVAYPLVSTWVAGSDKYCDAEGRRALQAALAIRREVGWGPGAVAEYQRRHLLEADGIVGPRTLADALR